MIRHLTFRHYQPGDHTPSFGIGPGTLYGAIARLESRGLIEPLDSEDRRNPYRLTALGETALRARRLKANAVQLSSEALLRAESRE